MIQKHLWLRGVCLFFLALAIQNGFSLARAQESDSASQSDEIKKQIKYWQNTPLKSQFLAQAGVLTQNSCTEDQLSPRACITGLQAMAVSGEPVRYLWPKALFSELAHEYNFYGVPVIVEKELQGYVLVRASKKDLEIDPKLFEVDPVTKKKLSLFEQVKRNKMKTEQMYQAIDQLGSSVNYDLLRDEIVKIVVTKENDAWLTMRALQNYFLFFDGHTSFVTSKELEDRSASDGDESFSGVGLVLRFYQNKILVENIIEGGPADKAKVIHVDDLITQVAQADGTSINTSGMTVAKVVKLLRGPSGTKVTITVEREGQLITADLIRQKVELKNVTVKMISYRDHNYGYIKLSSFMNANGCAQIKSGIEGLQVTNRLKGLVLDLRGNGGGSVEQAICMGGLFVGPKVITSFLDLNSNQMRKVASRQEKVTDLPLVVLQDAGSASASELLAGALRDYERAWIVGELSFGKGSAQAPKLFLPRQVKTESDVVIYVTQSLFLQPNGGTNQLSGIKPQFEVPIKPKATEEERFRMREADLVPNAIPPRTKTTWIETRVEKVSAIKACLTRGGQAEGEYNRLRAAHKNADFQLLSSLDVLSCQ